MSVEPVLNPELPYVGEIESGLIPGKMVKVQGKVPLESTRFAINYQLGPALNPRDDIALHVSPRFKEQFITRNHIQSMTWGPEENDGPMWIQPGTNFEIIILCEYKCYKIAVNGRHFTEFTHRLPYKDVTHLVIDGEVNITSIFYETIPVGPEPSAPLLNDSEIVVGPPPPGHLYPMLYPHGLPKEEPNSSMNVGDYKKDPSTNYGYNRETEDSENLTNDCLDKVGLAVGGLVAAGGVAAALHAMNKNKHKNTDEVNYEKSEHSQNESGLGGLGALGAALASSLSANAFQGDRTLHAQQGYPPQNSGVLGSILGALGGGGYQQPSSNPLDSILGGILGGSHNQQPQYQPPGNYNNYSQNQNSQNNDLISGIGGALLKSAMDGLSKRSHKSHEYNYDNSAEINSEPQPTTNYGSNMPKSHTPQSSTGERLTAAEISKGLGLSDDEE